MKRKSGENGGNKDTEVSDAGDIFGRKATKKIKWNN